MSTLNDTPPEASTAPDSGRKGGCSAMAGSALWMFFAVRFRDEYGFEPNPRDKSVREYFSWYAWGHAAHSMGWATNNKQHPLMDCPKCGEFRGHGHICEPNVKSAATGSGGNENE